MLLHPTLELVRQISDDVLDDMIKARLTSILDVESEFDYDQIKKIPQSHSGTIFGANLTQEGICSINQLIDHITMKNNIIQEGIFRKSGSLLRQTELQNNLCKGKTIVIDDKFTVHDSCCVLKKFISELPQPLLSTQLRSLWLQTLQLRKSSENLKQLNAVRLLLLLLPTTNRLFLGDLMKLFGKVLEHSEHNRMTAQSLSTIFASHLFLARDIKPERVCQLLKSVSDCLVFMIENSEEIFNPPPDLLRDAQVYLEKREKQNTNKFISTTSLSAIPYAKLCATSADSYAPKDYTELQLAELYAQVQSMGAGTPSSAAAAFKSNQSKSSKTNKKLIKKFNKQNGFGTPMLSVHKEQQALIKESMKRSAKMNGGGKKNNLKSLGSAIKKKCLMLTPNADKTLRSPSTSNSAKVKSSTDNVNLCGSTLISSQSLDQLNNQDQSSKIPILTETPKTARVSVTRKSSANSAASSHHHHKSSLKLTGNSPLKNRASLVSLKQQLAATPPSIVAALSASRQFESAICNSLQPRSSIRRNAYVNLRPLIVSRNTPGGNNSNKHGRPLPPLPKENQDENSSNPSVVIRRKSSLYSINEDVLSNITNNSSVSNSSQNTYKTNISTKSLPANSNTISKPHLEAELELIPRKVKKLAAKYESMPQRKSLLKLKNGDGRFVVEDSFSSDDEENGDYVCLSSIPIRSELLEKYPLDHYINRNSHQKTPRQNNHNVTISSWPKLNSTQQSFGLIPTNSQQKTKPRLASSSFNSSSISSSVSSGSRRTSNSFKQSTPLQTRLPTINTGLHHRSHRKAAIVDRHTAL